MPRRAEFARRFEGANGEAVEFVLGPGRGVWADLAPAEGWPVGVLARHICLWHERFIGWVLALQRGEPLPEEGDLHEFNAAQAAAGLVLTPDEAAECLRAKGGALLAAIAALTDEQFDGECQLGGQRRPVSEVVEVFVRHVDQHLASMRAVAEQSA